MAPKTNISWMTPSETLLRLGFGGFGDVKWAWGGGWCLPVFFPNFVFSWTLFRHSAFVRFDGPIFETEKLFENLCTTRASPVGAALGKNAASFNLIV